LIRLIGCQPRGSSYHLWFHGGWTRGLPVPPICVGLVRFLRPTRGCTRVGLSVAPALFCSSSRKPDRNSKNGRGQSSGNSNGEEKDRVPGPAEKCRPPSKPSRKAPHSPSPPLGGGEGRGEVGGLCGVAHLTLPIANAMGPLPLPPQAGGEGNFAVIVLRRQECVDTLACGGENGRWVAAGMGVSSGRKTPLRRRQERRAGSRARCPSVALAPCWELQGRSRRGAGSRLPTGSYSGQ
jgi:hypothetical protein